MQTKAIGQIQACLEGLKEGLNAKMDLRSPGQTSNVEVELDHEMQQLKSKIF